MITGQNVIFRLFQKIDVDAHTYIFQLDVAPLVILVNKSKTHALAEDGKFYCFQLRFTSSTFSVPPFTMTFCLSGWTPVRAKSWALNTMGGSSVFSSTASNFSFPHFTFTIISKTRRHVSDTAKSFSNPYLHVEKEVCIDLLNLLISSVLQNLS